MTNLQVIQKFLEGEKAQTPKRQILNGCFCYEGQTLTTDGKKLINYQTVIGYKEGNKLYINKKKYSRTTSKIQSCLRGEAQDFFKKENIIEYEG